MSGIQHARDISDDDFIAAVRAVRMPWGWATVGDLALHLDAPFKVVLAKLRRVIGRGLVDGCPCGCRGDVEVIADRGLFQ